MKSLYHILALKCDFGADTSLFGPADFLRNSIILMFAPWQTTWLICIIISKPTWRLLWIWSIDNKSWQDFFCYLWYCDKKTNWMWFTVALVKFHWFGINWHVFIQSECRNCCLYVIRKSRHKQNQENISKYGFSPDLGGKNGGVLSMRMQVILDSSFARPGSVPMWGGKKGEFRDWTM